MYMVIHGRNVYGCECERERVEMGWGTQGLLIVNL